MRLILHTAAYWLMWRIQQAIPKAAALATAEFATLRLRLLKVAARVIETATRIRVAFASACPDADMFRTIATRAQASADIAHAAVPPKAQTPSFNPASPSNSAMKKTQQRRSARSTRMDLPKSAGVRMRTVMNKRG